MFRVRQSLKIIDNHPAIHFEDYEAVRLANVAPVNDIEPLKVPHGCSAENIHIWNRQHPYYLPVPDGTYISIWETWPSHQVLSTIFECQLFV
jgi:hypothetical protein